MERGRIYLWISKTKYLEAIFHSFSSICFARFFVRNLHIHSIGASLIIPLAKLLGFKIIATHHGPDYKRKKWGPISRLFLKIGEYFMMHFADKVITVSQVIRKALISEYKRKDIYYIPNGVCKVEKIPAGKQLNRFNLEPGKYLISSGRFVPEKGFHDLIGAFKGISTNWKLVICGDADHETPYSRKLKEKGLTTENVVLTGYLTGRKLAEIYSYAGLFVLPSYYEGLPFVLLEALSYEIPVLVVISRRIKSFF